MMLVDEDNEDDGEGVTFNFQFASIEEDCGLV